MEEEVRYCHQRSKISLEKVEKIEHDEKGIKTMNLKFKATERKIRSYDAKMFSLRIDIKELTEKLKVEKAKTQLYHKGSNDILIED